MGKTILSVFGTRPEAIKMCPLIRELQKRPALTCPVCLSGQHGRLLRDAMAAFSVRASVNLRVMRRNQTPADIARRLWNRLPPYLLRVKPDLVLVHGDTTTAAVTAWAAFYSGIPVGHVEAGLRTYDMQNPYPEESNRRAIAAVATYHFAPTAVARDNLLREGIPPARVFVTGNTGIDALAYTVRPEFTHPRLTAAAGRRLVLISAHRRESRGAVLEGMLCGVRDALWPRRDIYAIYPVHPAVAPVARAVFADCPSVSVCEPLDVLVFHNLLARASLVISDSGGIQEEAVALGVPTLVLRDTTERPEGVAAGLLHIGGRGREVVREAIETLLDAPPAPRAPSSVYGSGTAARQIADLLMEEL